MKKSNNQEFFYYAFLILLIIAVTVFIDKKEGILGIIGVTAVMVNYWLFTIYQKIK